MSWIDDNPQIVKQVKEAVAACHISTDSWSHNEKKINNSYYIDYSESCHFGDNTIMVLDFDTPIDFKNCLELLWKEKDSYHQLIKLMMSFIMKSRNTPENILPEVDVHNYMM